MTTTTPTNTPAPRYSDATRMHWHALPADAKRGSLADGTAEVYVLTTGSLRGPGEWRPLPRLS